MSQDVFEYILIDKNYKIVKFSDGIERYIDAVPEEGDDALDYLPELIGYESRVEHIFNQSNIHYVIETVKKNNYYVNLYVEHYSSEIALILLHNITEITLSRLELLQYSNQNTLLYNTIQKILDSQNNLLFITHNNYIEDIDISYLPPEYFNHLYRYAKDKEQQISLGENTFLIKATLLEKTYKLFTLSNVTDLSSINQVLERNINHDPLTGIYRKHYFDKLLAEELQKEYAFSLVVIDIDNFKSVNDTYGHIAGDKTLQEFTAIIQKQLQHNDIFARWGGEEFLILIKHHQKEIIAEKVEAIRKSIEEHTFKDAGELTASFGIAVSKRNDTPTALFNRADEALYLAKGFGKNRVIFD